MSESAITNVLSRLERVHRIGGGWMARCPAHEDRSPSLKVAVGEDGRVLLSCKVGCPTERVIAELDLEWRDLFDGSGLPPRQNFVPKRVNRDSESSSRPETREDIEEDRDAGNMSVEEYFQRLQAWTLKASFPTKSRVKVEFDEFGEIIEYELRPDWQPIGDVS